MKRKKPPSGSGRRPRGSSSGDEDGEDEGAPRTDTDRRRRPSRTSGDGGGRASADAEKQKQQTIVVVAVIAGVLMLVLAFAILSGGDSHPSDEPEERATEAVKRVELERGALEGIKGIYSEAKSAYEEAQGLDGDAKTARLERARRKLDEVDERIAKQRALAGSSPRGTSFERLDELEQQMNQFKIVVRKALLEQKQ